MPAEDSADPEHSPERTSPQPASPSAPADLFLISFIILFLELACIRWFGSTVSYLTFFTNIVLMACVLGISVGCLAATQTRNYIQSVIPFVLVAALLAFGTLLAAEYDRIRVHVGDQRTPQQIYFGAKFRERGASANRFQSNSSRAWRSD